MVERIEKILLIGFSITAVLVAVVAIAAVSTLSHSFQASDWVNHTHGVIHEVDGIVSSMRAGDAALMSHLLTQHGRDLAAAREADAEMIEHVEVAVSLLKSDAPSAPLTEDLKTLAQRRAKMAEALVAEAGQLSREELQQKLTAEAPVEIAHRIQDVVGRLKGRQTSLLHERDRAAYLHAQATRWVVFAAVAVMVGLLAGCWWLVRDDIQARRRVVQTLQQVNEELEQRVQQRTEALARANETLTIQNLERTWANSALSHQARYSNLVLNAITEPIMVVTHTLTVVRVNAVVASLTGINEKDLIGSPLHQFLRGKVESREEPPAGAEGLEPVATAMKHAREMHAWPAWLRQAGGAWQPVILAAYPLRDADRVVGAVLTIQPNQT